jgi:F-type H+-transporting ATPase subunit delta
MKTSAQTRRQAKRLYQLCVMADSLNEERTRQVVGGVLNSKRRDSLAVLKEFQRLVRLDCEAHTATIETAVPLPSDIQEGVQARLKDLYGSGITTTFTLEPALIAGMRIKVGSDVYDGSVRSGLNALANSFGFREYELVRPNHPPERVRTVGK